MKAYFGKNHCEVKKMDRLLLTNLTQRAGDKMQNLTFEKGLALPWQELNFKANLSVCLTVHLIKPYPA
jgi:hypothetical protein